MLAREEIIAAFDLMLGVVPSEDQIAKIQTSVVTRSELGRHIVTSKEFMDRLHEISPVHADDHTPMPLSGRFEDFLRFAEGVEGWFTDMSASLFDSFLTAQANWGLQGDALEIGVAYGRSAILPAMHIRSNETLRVIDVSEPTLAGAAAMLRPITRGRLEPIRSSSFEVAADSYERNSVRFAHIDGDHSYNAVLNDMEIVDSVLGPDGIMVLDDFFAPQFAGITMAAGAYLHKNPEAFRLILTGFNKGYFCRPAAEQRYLHLIRDTFPKALRARQQSNFTFWRMLKTGQVGGFGLGNRQHDRDFVTLQTDVSAPIVFEEIPL